MDNQRQVQIGLIKSLFDELIDRHAEAYLEAYPDIKEFSSFEKSGTYNKYIGMVWTNDFEKPNTNSIQIRGSQSLTKNKTVDLNLSLIESPCSFFPGQIIAFRAEPHLKKQLTVTQFYDPMRIAPKMKKISTDSDIKLMLACGPFMKPELEDWTLFDKVVGAAITNEATHIVLLGPFVDIDNKYTRTQYETNWRLVFDKLVEGLHSQNCQVYLVPSTKDVLPGYLGSHYFYPTPEINIKMNLKKDARPKCIIKSVTDPAQIDLGGLYLDVTSAEVLLDFNRCASFMHKVQGAQRFIHMFRHILSHGIYPIYPQPGDTAIDYPKLEKFIKLDRLGPHIVVLPSRFPTALCENVDNRLVVTVQRCSAKKQVVLLTIPKIESSEVAPIDSIVLTDYKCNSIQLDPTSNLNETVSQVTDPSNTSGEMAPGSDPRQLSGELSAEMTPLPTSLEEIAM